MQGRDDAAPPLLAHVMANFPAQHDASESFWLDQARLLYVKCLLLNARYDEAVTQGQALLGEFERGYGSNSRRTLELRRYLSRAYGAERGRQHDCGCFALSARFGESSASTWRTRFMLMEFIDLMAQSDPHFVREGLEQSPAVLALARRTLPRDDYFYCRSLIVVIRAQISAGQVQQADQTLRELESLQAATAPDSHEHIEIGAQTDYARGILLQKQGDWDQASQRFHRALAVMLPDSGPDSREVRDLQSRLQQSNKV